MITVTRKEGVGDHPTQRVVILSVLAALRRLLEGLATKSHIVGEARPNNLVLEDAATTPSTIVEYTGPEAEKAVLVHGALFFLESRLKGITATTDNRVNAAMIAAMGYTEDEDFAAVMRMSTDTVFHALERKEGNPTSTFRDLVAARRPL